MALRKHGTASKWNLKVVDDNRAANFGQTCSIALEALCSVIGSLMAAN